VLHLFYLVLLILVAVAITWFAVYVVYRLIHEDK
jgi:hypothetical protein